MTADLPGKPAESEEFTVYARKSGHFEAVAEPIAKKSSPQEAAAGVTIISATQKPMTGKFLLFHPGFNN